MSRGHTILSDFPEVLSGGFLFFFEGATDTGCSRSPSKSSELNKQRGADTSAPKAERVEDEEDEEEEAWMC